MPSLEARLALLHDEPASAVAAVLAQTLSSAEPNEQQAICRALLGTGRPAAAAAVIQRLHRLGPWAYPMLGDVRTDLRPVVHTIVRQGRLQPILNALDLIQELALAQCVDLIAPLVESRMEDVGRRTAQVILSVVEATAGPGAWCDLRPLGRQRLDEAVSAGLLAYRNHRFDEILLAAALLAVRPGPLLAQILAEPDHPALYLLRGAVSQLGRPTVRRSLIPWLTVDSLQRSAARQLNRIDGPDALADVLENGHLLLAPSRRRAMRQVERPTRCVPPPATAVRLPAAAQVNLVRLITALSLRATARIERLADLIALPSPAGRMSALVALLGHDSITVDRAVEQFCFDRDEAVAAVAVRRCVAQTDAGNENLVRRLERSPHAGIAREATAMLARRGAGRFFQRWLDLAHNDRLAAAHAVAANDRRAMLAGLTRMLVDGARGQKLGAIDLVRRLRWSAALQRELIVHTGGTDSHVASAAVVALRDVRSTPSVEAIRTALRHDDARVRANAIESLMRLDRRGIERIVPMVTTRQNRPRANAVRALLAVRSAKGLPQLRAMLADPDPLHRISGIWVAKRTRALGVAGELQQLAKQDRFVEVRSRADAAARFLAHRPRTLVGAAP
ncbi:MAG: hypothetical protein IIA64_07630 [Planctomycetes bacterium]|nr:hypothetical protein [Planctomycetota bacterium]